MHNDLQLYFVSSVIIYGHVGLMIIKVIGKSALSIQWYCEMIMEWLRLKSNKYGMLNFMKSTDITIMGKVDMHYFYIE